MKRLSSGSVWVLTLLLAGCSGTTEQDVVSKAGSLAEEKEVAAEPPSVETELQDASEVPNAPEVPTALAAKDSTATEDFEAGLAAYQANDLPLAFKEFRAASKKGHSDSQFNLGLMYEQGIGVGKDETQAVVWYGESAARGNSAAQFNLGVLYENGRGTQVDFEKANKWYRSAAVQGDPLAIGNLGMLYIRGDGVAENKVAGVALLLVSATLDPSPSNFARRNIAETRGLTGDMIASAQKLSGEMSSGKDLLEQLDRYLLESAKDGSNN